MDIKIDLFHFKSRWFRISKLFVILNFGLTLIVIKDLYLLIFMY